MTKLLLKAGVQLEVRDTSGFTPLHLSSYNVHTAVMSALLEAGANSNTRNLNSLHRC